MIDDPLEEEEYRRRVEQERADREFEKGPDAVIDGVMFEFKIGHVPPDVAERQLRVYRHLLDL